MRIWDIEPKYLCSKHLLAEHRELHGLWNIITIHNCQGGYSHHPETIRWIGRQKALYLRHQLLVEEFNHRGFHHKTPLNASLAIGEEIQTTFLNSLEDQKIILKEKNCACLLSQTKE